MNQGGGGTGYQYQYRPTQQQPSNHAPQNTAPPQSCSVTSAYHDGPHATIMTTGTQPTVQVYGAVVPQQTATVMPSQDPRQQTVMAPPSSAPPPVPAPVPPVVPLSQPQSSSTATIVAMAPIAVTVPISGGVPQQPATYILYIYIYLVFLGYEGPLCAE